MDESTRERSAAVATRRAERSVKKAEEKAARAAEWVTFRSAKQQSDDTAAKRRADSAAADVETARATAREFLGAANPAPAAEAGSDLGAVDEGVEGLDMGKAAEEAATKEACYWDQDIHAELQVELLLTLQRLSDQFAAAAMSIQHSRAFDAVTMVVPGLIAALADSILRRLATDRPSKFTGVLLGLNAGDGRRLGFPGFGLSVGSFAEQTETMEVHYPGALCPQFADESIRFWRKCFN